MIYFDHHAKAPLSSKALERMIFFLKERAVSDSLLKEGYQRLYALLEADEEDHFLFTSSGAEAVNHVIFASYVDVTRKTGKNHFISAVTDEAPAIMAMTRLQELGCVYQMAPVNSQGIVTPKLLSETLTPRTALFSISWANGLTGVLQPVKELASVCQERGVLFHVDATHVIGKGHFTFEESAADFLTFNGEAFHGPSGSGGLFIRKDLGISPFILGGEEQAQMRGGTFSNSTFFGLAEASQEAKEERDLFALEGARLREHFENLILEKTPYVRFLFKDTERLPNVSLALFPGAASDALLYLLNRKNVFASFGGGTFQHLRHILKACGLKESFCHSALSFSFSRNTTEEEVEKGAQIISETVKELQSHSKAFTEDFTWA